MKIATVTASLSLGLMPFLFGCKPKSKSPVDNSKSQQGDPSEAPTKKIEFQPEKMFRSAEGKKAVQRFRLAQADLEKPGDRLLLLARCGNPEGKGPERLERVKDPESWPSDRLVMYVFLLDSSNRIRLFQIVPNSESGDWYEQNDYLFTTDGSLQYWEHYFGSFNPDQPQKAWYAYAWSPTGASLDKAVKFLGADGRPWKGAPPKGPTAPPQQLRALLDQHKLTDTLLGAKVELPQSKQSSGTGSQDA